MSTYKLLYNGVGQITSALYRNAADTATIIGYEHDYDDMGNPEYEVRVHQSDDGDEYTYDSLYRVTRAVYDDPTPTAPTTSPAAADTDDFVYDDVGNRITAYLQSATATTYQYNDVNECTKRDLNDSITYDQSGNMTFDSEYSYLYDHLNRVTKINTNSNPSLAVAYLYDADGRLVERTIYDGAAGTSYVQYFYDGLAVIEEREDDGTLIATYVNGPGIDEYILMNRDSTDYWYMQSPILGNVAALVNSSGEVQEGYKYRAYGQATVLTSDGDDDTWFTSDDDTATTSALGNPYTFNGRRLESVSLDLYYRNRVLHRELGRFTSRDPLGYVDGMNLYEYVGSNPVGLTDPFGLTIFFPGGIIHGTNKFGQKRSYKWVHCREKRLFRKDLEVRIGSYRMNDRIVDIGGYEVPYQDVKDKEEADGCMKWKEWYKWAKEVGYNPRGFDGHLDANPQGHSVTAAFFGLDNTRIPAHSGRFLDCQARCVQMNTADERLLKPVIGRVADAVPLAAVGNAFGNVVCGPAVKKTGGFIMDPHATSWMHKAGARLGKAIHGNTYNGVGKTLSKSGRAAGRAAVWVTIAEGTWDWGAISYCTGRCLSNPTAY